MLTRLTEPDPLHRILPLEQGGSSHMVRFAGNMHARSHRFWFERPAGSQLSIRLYVKHVEESAAATELLAQLPDWASPAAGGWVE